jgi:hypothetical protein
MEYCEVLYCVYLESTKRGEDVKNLGSHIKENVKRDVPHPP